MKQVRHNTAFHISNYYTKQLYKSYHGILPGYKYHSAKNASLRESKLLSVRFQSGIIKRARLADTASLPLLIEQSRLANAASDGLML